LRVSKGVREETASVYYLENTFHINAFGESMSSTQPGPTEQFVADVKKNVSDFTDGSCTDRHQTNLRWVDILLLVLSWWYNSWENSWETALEEEIEESRWQKRLSTVISMVLTLASCILARYLLSCDAYELETLAQYFVLWLLKFGLIWQPRMQRAFSWVMTKIAPRVRWDIYFTLTHWAPRDWTWRHPVYLLIIFVVGGGIKGACEIITAASRGEL